MKMQLLLAAAGTALLLAAAPVMAGTCTDQISSLEKILSSKDAGQGPTNGSQASGQNSSASSSEQLASADQSAAEGGSTPKAGQVPDTAGTPLMNQAAQGKATSPQDVLKQNEGQPTVGDTAQAQSLGQSTQVAGSSPMEASNLLKQAKDLDKAGKENECMAIIQKAKQQIGAQ
jgi:hypothetical protein